jgi:hypothetical protein
VVRRLAHRGLACEGVELSRRALVPEVTVTADGVYWHPVGADDGDLLVAGGDIPVADAVSRVSDLFRVELRRGDALAEVFPCA